MEQLIEQKRGQITNRIKEFWNTLNEIVYLGYVDLNELTSDN